MALVTQCDPPQLLLSRRSGKAPFPNMWICCGQTALVDAFTKMRQTPREITPPIESLWIYRLGAHGTRRSSLAGHSRHATERMSEKCALTLLNVRAALCASAVRGVYWHLGARKAMANNRGSCERRRRTPHATAISPFPQRAAFCQQDGVKLRVKQESRWSIRTTDR